VELLTFVWSHSSRNLTYPHSLVWTAETCVCNPDPVCTFVDVQEFLTPVVMAPDDPVHALGKPVDLKICRVVPASSQARARGR